MCTEGGPYGEARVLIFLTLKNVYFIKYKAYKQLGKLVEKLAKIPTLRGTGVHVNISFFFFFTECLLKLFNVQYLICHCGSSLLSR